MRIVELHSTDELARFPGNPVFPLVSADDFREHGADVHLCAVGNDGRAVAQCSLWWTHVPPHPEHRIGAIGHFSSIEELGTQDLLAHAMDRLRAASCTLAVGPMDGNTWRRYRFVTERGSEPPFFLEPENPAQWPLEFERAGFSALASYFSALNTELCREDTRVQGMARKMGSAGVTIRPLDNKRVNDDLHRIYQISQAAFTRNFLYTELSEQAFTDQYTRILPYVLSDLVLIAERDGRPTGYLFAIPDLAQRMRGAAIDTFIIKTVAVLPDPSLAGLGTLLVARAQEAGHRLGFRRCIHALMHENNISLNISRHYARIMRRYTLYSKVLAP